MASNRVSRAAFVGVSALLFAGSATLTIVWCASMPPMPMPMHEIQEAWRGRV